MVQIRPEPLGLCKLPRQPAPCRHPGRRRRRNSPPRRLPCDRCGRRP